MVWQTVAATAAATSKLVFIVGSGDSAGDLLKPPSANVCLISKVAEFFSAYNFFATTYSFPQTLTQQFVDLCLDYMYVYVGVFHFPRNIFMSMGVNK